MWEELPKMQMALSCSSPVKQAIAGGRPFACCLFSLFLTMAADSFAVVRISVFRPPSPPTERFSLPGWSLVVWGTLRFSASQGDTDVGAVSI